jgi:hypothetical protein
LGTFRSIETSLITSATLCRLQTGGFEPFFLEHCSAMSPTSIPNPELDVFNQENTFPAEILLSVT